MIRALRSHMKLIFFILIVIPFVAWMVFDVSGLTGGGITTRDVVLKVNGKEYHAPEYQTRRQAAFEQYRQQYGSGRLTREEEQAIEEQFVNQLIQEALLEQEYRRLGIRATDAEVVEAARTSPPPEITRDPQFHTDGRFDIRKWQQFLASQNDPRLLAQIEALYRDRIPLAKLEQYVTADVYVSDAKLWRIYKDQHDSARIASLPVWPYLIQDSIALSDDELTRYVEDHPDDFKRPAIAYVRFVALPRLPNAADTAASREIVSRVSVALARGSKFEDVARRESTDTISGQRGGDLGWIKRNDTNFDADFMTAVRRLRPGQVSTPVKTQFGFHFIRIDDAKGDSVKVRHILIPVTLHGQHLEYVEARADTLERIAAERTDPAALDSAARRLELQVSSSYQLFEGSPFRLGRYQVPDVSVWAFEAPVGETSPVIEGEAAFYVFRLDSVAPGGVPPLFQVRQRAEQAVRLEKQKVIARRRADSLATALKNTPDLAATAAARGFEVQRFGPFTRLRPPSYLQREPEVVGAAFGLGVGERSGVIEGEGGLFIIESMGRKLADSSAWLAQRDAQRAQLLNTVKGARWQQYFEGLRARAKIVDRRKELFRQAAAAEDAGF